MRRVTAQLPHLEPRVGGGVEHPQMRNGSCPHRSHVSVLPPPGTRRSQAPPDADRRSNILEPRVGGGAKHPQMRNGSCPHHSSCEGKNGARQNFVIAEQLLRRTPGPGRRGRKAKVRETRKEENPIDHKTGLPAMVYGPRREKDERQQISVDRSDRSAG